MLKREVVVLAILYFVADRGKRIDHIFANLADERQPNWNNNIGQCAYGYSNEITNLLLANVVPQLTCRFLTLNKPGPSPSLFFLFFFYVDL